MNQDWHDLIQHHMAGLLDEAEAAAFQDALRAQPELRKLYLHYINLDLALEARASSAETTSILLLADPTPAAPRHSRWLQWRPLGAAAAGLVFGILSASMVWAYAVPLAGRSIERAVAIFAEGFENPQLAPGRGFPTSANRWSGDLSMPVGAESDVKPPEGGRMVRLAPTPKRKYSYAWRIVDLADLPGTVTAKSLRLEVSASFNASGPARPSRYQIRLAAFSEKPEEVRAIWNNEPLLFDTVLQHVGRNVLTKPGDTGWQAVRAAIQIPPGTRSVVVSLAAGEADPAQPMSEHYLDDVHAQFFITQRPTE